MTITRTREVNAIYTYEQTNRLISRCDDVLRELNEMAGIMGSDVLAINISYETIRSLRNKLVGTMV